MRWMRPVEAVQASNRKQLQCPPTTAAKKRARTGVEHGVVDDCDDAARNQPRKHVREVRVVRESDAEKQWRRKVVWIVGKLRVGSCSGSASVCSPLAHMEQEGMEKG